MEYARKGTLGGYKPVSEAEDYTHILLTAMELYSGPAGGESGCHQTLWGQLMPIPPAPMVSLVQGVML